MAKPKTKMEMFDEFFKKNGYRHKADPRHAMNAEGTRPKKKEGTKMMDHGGMGKKKPKMIAIVAIPKRVCEKCKTFSPTC